MRNATALLFLFMSLNAVAGKSRKDVPIAPLPAVIVNAEKVFLTNGGGSDLSYDTLYSEMKTWGKHQIVGSPDQADLIIELAYRVEHGGTRVWSSNNSYDGTTQVHSTQIVARSLSSQSTTRSRGTLCGPRLTTGDSRVGKRTEKRKQLTRRKGWSTS